MKLLPIAPLPHETDERLGFFDRSGRRICAHCYFRLSTADRYVRVRLTRILPAVGLSETIVSSIWTGTDPHAIEEKRGPLPFLTLIYPRDRDLDVTVLRSASDAHARHTHRAAVERVCTEVGGRAFDVELFRPEDRADAGEPVGVQ